ncbi:hypothetical protein HG536_0A04810 [Torulaspora globosa]|uniref:HAD family hydrolase n=1 Tax=Torulaspora globosa TaxID=48254 RepID=A0A7G3ZAX9_9SACH|nr:uncharacterized protein HG536_0A04810 [Torulaspora globosa]QLL30665.1 hypothetical protein HG536_0A04810 [Torulaspora globosa]
MCPRNRLKSIKAVIFDMDGTLCLPQPWMFPAMRQAVGLHDSSIDILTFIDRLSTPLERAEAHRRIQQVEAQAMAEMQPQPGLVTLMRFLTKHGISKSICTRNLQEPVDFLIDRFLPAEYSHFDYILTREFKPTKPSADPLLHIARSLGIEPAHIAMVGDSRDDLLSGRAAGCTTVLVHHASNASLLASDEDAQMIDFVVRDLAELVTLLSV